LSKRILLLLLGFMLLVCPSAFAGEDGNLLVNPGFEEIGSNGLPVGWYTDAYVKREGVSRFSVTEEGLDSQAAALIENFDMNDARFAQTVKVRANSMYRLSGWIKAEDILDAGHGANLSVEGVYVFSESLYDTRGEWVYIETYGLTAEDQTEVTIFARVGGYSGESQGSAAFDNLSLVEVEALPVDVFADAWYTIPSIEVLDETNDNSTDAPQPFWPWLIVLSLVFSIAALFASKPLQFDRRERALREAAENSGILRGVPTLMIVGLFIASALRIAIASLVEGYQVDVNCFTAWGNTMASVGPTLFYQSNWCDYTPGFIYVMGLNGLLSKLFSGVVTAAFVHKIVPMACDVIAACLIYRMATEHEFSRRQAGILSLLVAFNPAAIINSAAWCQIDSVLCVGLMMVAYFAVKRKWVVVLPVYVLCILVKPQALMLGFLGLTALTLEWLRNPPEVKGKLLSSKPRRDMLIGVIISAVLALVIILPFCPNQESPWWLIEQYSTTLQSYPYATVNTANLFYLFNANWDGIENAASLGTCIFFAIATLVWAVYTFIKQQGTKKLWFIEPSISAGYALIYLILCFTGCSWLTLGVFTMSMAFALVLPMFIRSGKYEMLPLCGAVIFLLLYVFGIKMHERYLFPALFLLGMAYALHRDRRILWLLIGSSVVLFINEGIVLDNSIRLGSAMGHLNADTDMLAKLLSVLNVLFALAGIWICHNVCVENAAAKLIMADESDTVKSGPVEHPCTALNFKANAKLGLSRRDGLLMLIVTLIYSIVTLTTLGSTKAPQTAWKSSAMDEYVVIDLGKHYDDFSMLYFCQVSYQDFAIAVSDTNEEDSWSEDYPAQMAQGQCFQWKYLNPSYKSGNNTTYVEASDFANVQKLSGRYVRINPKQVGLVINELLFKDADGSVIPNVSVVSRENAYETSPLYSDPANLLDEQDTLDGEPSWWNSTYFDEIYHARTAFEHLNGTNAYEWTHPPLGKIIMSWFVGLFGMTPFGWRFAGALCGILMLPAMFLLVKQLTKRTDMAFVGMMLMTLDCMHFTQTRIATIDSYPVLFIMLSYFFMLRFMQRDIVLEDIRRVLPDLALSGFFMGCGFASKWIGAYAGIGLAVLYFWTCMRHLRLGKLSADLLAHQEIPDGVERKQLETRMNGSLRRIILLCLWCLLFFVAVPVIIYLLCYVVHFADRHFNTLWDFLVTVYETNFSMAPGTTSMLSYHGTPGLGMDHTFYSPWYEWPLMITPMYYASAAFKPEGMTYAIFCFGNPWVWLVGLAGIAYTIYRWVMGHYYNLAGREGCIQLLRKNWEIDSAFILIGLLAQFLPWVLVPRGTYIYHYFASVPFLILGVILMLDSFTRRHPLLGKKVVLIYLVLCFIWFVLLFPYASGLPTPEEWMDFIRDYPYLNLLDQYWNHDWMISLNNFLEKIPIFPHVYHH